ncbi:MAG: hypothetical protein J6O40_02545 [Ruminococcus sp.]|nr:hypothetical protein [Ruminococcus sp.]
MAALRHALVFVIAMGLLLGLPFFTSDYFKAKVNGSDAVTGATTALDAPSGEYVVAINLDRHTDDAALECWREFFEKGESEGLYNVFEDLSCTVSSSDPSGLEMAKSFQSRLPENQMKIRTEDGIMMLSKAENGRFDIIVMSKEFFDKNSGKDIEEKANALLIRVKGEV